MLKEYSLGTVILAYNSEKKLSKCLESLEGWCDDIVIVDGGSTDNTVTIAKNSGARVYIHPFSGSFAEERNFGAEKSNSEWVLQLDSDEVLSEGFKRKCDLILPETHFAAFKFWRKNVFLGHPFTYGGWYHMSQHLYKKGYAHYEGRVHEKMLVKGETGCIEGDVLHYPFDSISEFIERQNRYTDLQAQDILDSGEKPDMKKIKYNLTFKPLKLFKKMYLDKKGYKEGIYGFIFSMFFSYVHFLKWAKVWEKIKT